MTVFHYQTVHQCYVLLHAQKWTYISSVIISDATGQIVIGSTTSAIPFAVAMYSHQY